MTVDELTDVVVDWERERTPSSLGAPDRSRIREQLVEVDLPALAESGLVVFNADEGIVGRYEDEAVPTESERPAESPAANTVVTPAAVGVGILAACLAVAVAVLVLELPVVAVSVVVSVLVLVGVALVTSGARD